MGDMLTMVLRNNNDSGKGIIYSRAPLMLLRIG
jgi:hypothetical protein